MTERQFRTSGFEANRRMHGHYNPALAKIALVSDVYEITPDPTDDTPSAKPNLTSVSAGSSDSSGTEPLPKGEGGVTAYKSSYNHDDLKLYAKWRSAQDSTSEKNNEAFWTGKAERAHAELQHELFYPSRLHIPSKAFVIFLEDKDIAVGQKAAVRAKTQRQDLNLPIDILLEALTQMVPEEKDDADKKLLLRKNFSQIRLEAYKFLIGYCKAALEQSEQRE